MIRRRQCAHSVARGRLLRSDDELAQPCERLLMPGRLPIGRMPKVGNDVGVGGEACRRARGDERRKGVLHRFIAFIFHTQSPHNHPHIKRTELKDTTPSIIKVLLGGALDKLLPTAVPRTPARCISSHRALHTLRPQTSPQSMYITLSRDTDLDVFAHSQFRSHIT